MMTLDAQAVGVLDSKQLKCFTIGFAEGADGSGPALLFQRAHFFDEQDVELGQDTYCLVTHSQATTYGGVKRWALSDGRFELTLSSKAADDLGCDQDLTVLFAPELTAEVRGALHRIFTKKTAVTPRKKKTARPKHAPPRKKAAPPRKRAAAPRKQAAARSTRNKASPRKKQTKNRPTRS